jgi:hypothetical protein
MDDIALDIVFCVMFVLVPLLSLKLLSFSGVSLRRFSIASFFILFYIIFDYIGILPIYFKMNPNFLPRGIFHKEIILELFLFSSTALTVTILGFIYGHHVLGFNCGDKKNRILLKTNKAQLLLIFLLFIVCGMVLLAYLNQIQSVALIRALSGDIDGANIARSEMGNNFPGAYWRYHIFFRPILDYCLIFFFADFLITSRRISGLMFGMILIVAVFSATMAIEKGPLINLLIMLYVTYVIYKGGDYWQLSTKYIAITMLSLLILFDFYFMGNQGVILALQNISSRVFTGQIAPAYFYLELFPHHIDYLWGRSFPNPGGLFPFENFHLTVELSKIISPESFAKGIVGSAPTVYWGEMYANFGAIGVILPSFFVGLGLFTVGHILSKFSLSPVVLAATVSLAMHYRNLTVTGLSNYFFDTTFFAIVLITFSSLLLDKDFLLNRLRVPSIESDQIKNNGK